MNTINFYEVDWYPDCQRANTHLKEKNINFIDVDFDKEVTAKMEVINNGKCILSTIIINNKSYANLDNIVLFNILNTS